MKFFLTWTAVVMITSASLAEDGYELWLRYERLEDKRINEIQQTFKSIHLSFNDATAELIRKELHRAFTSLSGRNLPETQVPSDGSLLIITAQSQLAKDPEIAPRLTKTGKEGFVILSRVIDGKKITVIAANSSIGCYYGTFHLLRLIQSSDPLNLLNLESAPAIQRRILNHWDNLDRTVERGYAGFSLWDWHKLPGYIDPRYHDYARANASIGINGTVLTNVNANALILTPAYLEKVKALADLFRPYGITVYLTARFSAPMEIGGLRTADPLDKSVQQWWVEKAKEIYAVIPDFGGFVVKANSEGQPGPQNYGRNHADGANMLANAVGPFGGIVMWRAFVYDNNVPVDRVKQAYNEFKPLDGKFRDNVIIQVKNGPLDFQPREPFHPLFGAMKTTPLMMEFQITQEYLGFASHLVYLATLFKETLDSDTYQKGKGSTVARAVDGTLFNHKLSAIAGVTNIGNDRNWCGHPFAQSNWYAYGRLAWNLSLDPRSIATEWASETFTYDQTAIGEITDMMMRSREITVNYMTPLGLHHIMGWSHHYGPAPWIDKKERADWTSVYYHKADKNGIGFDRTQKGSNALEQYAPEVQALYKDVSTCPEEYLLWFHHVPWDYKTRSGRILWDELCYRYSSAADDVQALQTKWLQLKGKVDAQRFEHVNMLLSIQHDEAEWWRDACLTYFQTFSQREFPSFMKKPARTLEHYQSLEFPFAPGIRPKW